MPNDNIAADPETLMRDLAAAVHKHAGPTSNGMLASIGVPALGIEDIHFAADGEPTVAFRTGGGAVEERILDAEECQAISGFFAGLAHILGYKP